MNFEDPSDSLPQNIHPGGDERPRDLGAIHEEVQGVTDQFCWRFHRLELSLKLLELALEPFLFGLGVAHEEG